MKWEMAKIQIRDSVIRYSQNKSKELRYFKLRIHKGIDQVSDSNLVVIDKLEICLALKQRAI